MTYRELDYKATRLLDNGKITLGEYEEMTKPLDREVEQEPRKDEVILTKEEYGELVSNEFDNGYAKGYREALEQESILDKIRAEISALKSHHINDCYDDGFQACRANVLQIIDKYRAESEG